jgi:DNA-binding NtrC family response regulator
VQFVQLSLQTGRNTVTDVERVKILLVEAEPALRCRMRRLLEAEGYGVEEAADGKLALGALASTGFDAVLAGGDMPGMGAWSLYQLALACAPEIAGRVVFCGGTGPLPHAARHVRRPFVWSGVLAEVQAVLGGPKAAGGCGR